MAEKKKPTKAEFIKRWVAALRSGKYKQGKNRLKSVEYDYKASPNEKGELVAEDHYCCLAIACIVANEMGIKVSQKYIDAKLYLPLQVSQFLGVSNEGSFDRRVILNVRKGQRFFRSLVDMNDSNISFRRIATVIEKQYPKGNLTNGIKPY